MGSITCPGCRAYLGLSAADAAYCSRCGSSLTGGQRADSAGRADDGAEVYDLEPADRGHDLGRRLLVVTTVFLAFDLGLRVLDALEGNFPPKDITHAVVNVLVLRGLWRGSAICRWLLAVGLTIGGAIVLVATWAIPAYPPFTPGQLAWGTGIGVVCGAIGIGLATPPVGAYLAELRRRRARPAE